MCPSSLASECVEISKMNPELAKGWNQKLEAWATQNGLPREFVKLGFWRWKQLPPKMKELADKIGIKASSKRADTSSLHVLKGVSPCVTGGYSVEAVLEMPKSQGLKEVAELLKTVGAVRLVEDFGVAMLESSKGQGKVFAGGQISSVGTDPDRALQLFDDIARAVLRAHMCTKCGICVKTCPENAIKLDGSVVVDAERCTMCGKCSDSCVVAHYFDMVSGEMPAAKGRASAR